MMRKLSAALVVAFVVLSSAVLSGVALVAPSQAAALSPTAPASHRLRPIVFVHGFFGSGSQYETPARRFASNGYPARYIESQEYDSTFATTTVDAVYAQLDARIDRLLTETGAERVDLVGHSLGTAMSQGYLNSSPARAARVAHYVNLDGATATALPGGVPTLAIWGEGSTARTVTGATNVYLSDESHTQTVTSAPSFEAQYRFLTGYRPWTTLIVPQLPGQVQLSGRAVLFPSNAGAEGATVRVFEVSAATGHRLAGRPAATFTLGADGAWGPMRAKGWASYEFAISRPDSTSVHHLYFQPFLRTDRLVRLLTSEPGTGLDALTQQSDRHTNLIVTRNKEWWGDQGAAGDTLTVDGTSILSASTAPRTKRAIGIFAFDAGLDGVSHADVQLPAFAALPFISGVDLFVPAANPPAATVRLASRQRGAGGATDVVDVPNWPSSTDRVSVQFNDYNQSRWWRGDAS
jgi:pimeloyl-ACP methyl ester carboxylesterase